MWKEGYSVCKDRVGKKGVGLHVSLSLILKAEQRQLRWLAGNPVYHFLSFQFSELEDIKEKGSIEEGNREKVMGIIFFKIYEIMLIKSFSVVFIC